jgi:threonyl-tRNA synthetase
MMQAKKFLLALSVFCMFIPIAAQSPAPKTAPILLTQDDLSKLEKVIQNVQLTRLDLERAQARYDQSLNAFNQAKAEIIGDHGLAPSKHDLAPDFKSIISKPEPK